MESPSAFLREDLRFSQRAKGRKQLDECKTVKAPKAGNLAIPPSREARVAVYRRGDVPVNCRKTRIKVGQRLKDHSEVWI
jgi:hypothetical protein